MTDKENANACPECGVDLTTGKPPEPPELDRKYHAVMHWGTDNPDTLTNPEARRRAKIVLGVSDDAKREG